ncbi:hypothetical protein [Salinigranum salinum]|uniref:hypothetical protein n=1 Tax=Salinigranum salinum TaxID=1364937 RepID=UPI0012608554|nr:hypothetical protein [Salinigranum salinum]
MFSRARSSNCEHGQSSSAAPTDESDSVQRVHRFRRRLDHGRVLTECYLFAAVGVVAFWVAVAVPFFYLPLLSRGLETRGELLVFVALVAVNVVALGLGHHHRHPGTDPDTGRGN